MENNQDVCILGFDTATRGCSAALWDGGGIVGSASKEMERGQSEALMPMIENLLQETGKSYADLDALAVTNGPGAFTGLRIGLAAARGMALASRLPVFAVTTLEAVAYGIDAPEREGRTAFIALDSKRADHYVQLFSESLDPVCDPQALLPDELDQIAITGPLIVAGDAAASAQHALEQRGFQCTLSKASGLPDAKVIAARAATRWHQGERPTKMPEPLYLRPPDVSRPR